MCGTYGSVESRREGQEGVYEQVLAPGGGDTQAGRGFNDGLEHKLQIEALELVQRRGGSAME